MVLPVDVCHVMDRYHDISITETKSFMKMPTNHIDNSIYDSIYKKIKIISSMNLVCGGLYSFQLFT